MEFRSMYTKALMSLCYLLRENNYYTYVQPIIGVRFAQLMPELYSRDPSPTFLSLFRHRRGNGHKISYGKPSSFLNDFIEGYLCDCETGDCDKRTEENNFYQESTYITCSRDMYDIAEKNKRRFYDDYDRQIIKHMYKGEYDTAIDIMNETWSHRLLSLSHAIYYRKCCIGQIYRSDRYYPWVLKAASEGEYRAFELYRYIHMMNKEDYSIGGIDIIISITALVYMCNYLYVTRIVPDGFTYIFRRAIGHFSVSFDGAEKRLKETYAEVCSKLFDRTSMISCVIAIAPEESGLLISLIRRILQHSSERDQILEQYEQAHMITARIEDYWLYVRSENYDLPHLRKSSLEKIDRVISINRDKRLFKRIIDNLPEYESGEISCCQCS